VSIKRRLVNILPWAYQEHPAYYVVVRDKTRNKRVELVLKRHNSEQSAQEEFDLLTELNRHFANSDGRFGVPVPVGMIPDLQGLLMSRVPGKRLSEIVWSSVTIRNRRERATIALDAIRKAASWLVVYQKAPCHLGHPHGIGGPTHQSELRGHIDETLEMCREHGIHANAIAAINDWFDNIDGSRLTTTCVPKCDFNPTHVFLSEDRTSVIDFEAVSCGWPGENLADFIAYCQVFRKTITPPAVSLEELRETFIREYASQVKFGPIHEVSLEASYALQLLETFLLPWTDQGHSWAKEASLFRNSFFAKREIVKRTSTGEWQTILSKD
jgi:aminoglycoside phosphotransferase (APT) family kinase protein